MTDTEIKANLYALEQRIYQLEQKIKHMADVGDMVEVEKPGMLYFKRRRHGGNNSKISVQICCGG